MAHDLLITQRVKDLYYWLIQGNDELIAHNARELVRITILAISETEDKVHKIRELLNSVESGGGEFSPLEKQIYDVIESGSAEWKEALSTDAMWS